MLAILIYGIVLFSLFLVGGYYFKWGRPQHLLAWSLIAVALGFFGGVWWFRFLKKNLKEGVFSSDAYGARSHLVFLAGGSLLYYFTIATKYSAPIYWVMCLASISSLLYSAIAIAFLQHRTGQTIRYTSSKKESYWMALYIAAFILVSVLAELTGRSSP